MKRLRRRAMQEFLLAANTHNFCLFPNESKKFVRNELDKTAITCYLLHIAVV